MSNLRNDPDGFYERETRHLIADAKSGNLLYPEKWAFAEALLEDARKWQEHQCPLGERIEASWDSGRREAIEWAADWIDNQDLPCSGERLRLAAREAGWLP